MSTPPGVIPYVDVHDGPKRVLTVTLEMAALLGGPAAGVVKPNLFIDGRQYIVYWGPVHVEVPADRAVHVGVGMQDGLRGASLLLPPGSAPAGLHYRVTSTTADLSVVQHG